MKKKKITVVTREKTPKTEESNHNGGRLGQWKMCKLLAILCDQMPLMGILVIFLIKLHHNQLFVKHSANYLS